MKRKYVRAFIAIEIPAAIKIAMAAAQDRLKTAGVDATWSRPEGVHLTLKFLGEVNEERGPEIIRVLKDALHDTERFRIGIAGVGTFPNPINPRVVWVGIAGDLAHLAALHAAVEQALAGVGLEREQRPFTPHLTLGRIKRIRDQGAWLTALGGIGGFEIPAFPVASISLMSSELKPAGAVYREIGTVALK